MTSSPSLAHDQPIPFDTAPDQRNDPFNFASTPSSLPTTSHTSQNATDPAHDVSSLFGSTTDATFFNQPLSSTMQHQPIAEPQVLHQLSQSQPHDLHQQQQQQQQYEPLGSTLPAQTAHLEQQYAPTETQQWQQFDPNVHYYYDDQGQYHYYDPNTGQEYDYTQYTYQAAYDPQQYYMGDQQQQQQQQYTNTTASSGTVDLGGSTSNDLGYGALNTANTGVYTTDTPLLHEHGQPTATPGMAPQPIEQKDPSVATAIQQEGTHIQDAAEPVGQVLEHGNGSLTIDEQHTTPHSDVQPQSAVPSQKWDQVDMDGQTDALLAAQANDKPSTLYTDPTTERTIDALGDDLDDLILGGRAKEIDSVPPPTTAYTPINYNNPVSRSATPQIPAETTITCVNPSCQTLNKPASKFCEECGTPFVGNVSRAQTPAAQTSYIPTPSAVAAPAPALQETTVPTYDSSAYNRSYSPAIQENRYSPAPATPMYNPPQQQVYNTHNSVPLYNEPQQYISRSATPVYNPLPPNQAQESSTYPASSSHPVYPGATTSTSVYDPSYYDNSTPAPPPIGSQQHYPPDAYSAAAVQPSIAATTMTRATAQPPIDQDPLQRIKGCPLIQFGFGGKLCMMFPRSVQQYGGSYGSNASTKRTPGAIQIKTVTDPTNTRNDDGEAAHLLQAFVGPLLQDPDFSVKNKKKQVLAYMEQRILAMENIPSTTLSDPHSRVLLWKLVKLMIEQDGNVGESETTSKSVLDLLGLPTVQPSNSFSVPAYDKFNQTQQEPQEADVSDMVLDKLQGYLAQGDRRGAVNYAIQEDLWSHALVISSCVDRSMWQSVVRGFTQRELAGGGSKRTHHHIEGNRPGLRVLYALFSGLGASSLSEFFVADKQRSSLGNDRAQTPDGSMTRAHPSLQPDELCQWQEVLGLIMANRTTKDYEAITALGDIMKNHGWINAAHICYILSPQSSPLSGLDTPYVRYTLVGTNSLLEILKDVDSYLLTELLEFALSLRPIANGGGSCLPYLQGYKLVHAWWLADMGLVKEAGRYCAAINQCIKTHSKESPYLHQHLLAKVKELTELCNEYHGKKGLGMDVTSWLKPSFKKNTLDSFWGSIEGKFNKFVSGDDTQMEESSGRKSTEIKATTFETNIEPPARSASAVDFRMQQPSQMSSYLSFKRFK